MELVKLAAISEIVVGDRHRKDLGDVEALASSISGIGLLQPIGITSDNELVFGERRLEAFKSLGKTHIPTRIVDLDSLVKGEHDENEMRKQFTPSEREAIAAKIERLSPERRGRPGENVAHVPHLKGEKTRDIAAKQAGFSSTSQYRNTKKVVEQGSPELVDAMDTGIASIRAAADLAELPQNEQAEVVARGEDEILKRAKEIRKQKAEQRREKQIEKEIAASRIITLDRLWHVTSDQDVIECDAVITDPPYGILNEPWEPERLEDFTRDWVGRWNESGADLFLVFWSQRYLYDGRVWLDEELNNYEFTQTLVWHYPNNKGPQSRRMFKQTWEPVYFYRRIGSEREIAVGAGEWGDGLNDFDCHVAAVPQSNFNDSERKQHPAQKSVSVMRWLINASTHPGELVADPFMGSGTTGIAASKLGRRFHGIEISDEYKTIAERRLAAYG